MQSKPPRVRAGVTTLKKLCCNSRRFLYRSNSSFSEPVALSQPPLEPATQPFTTSVECTLTDIQKAATSSAPLRMKGNHLKLPIEPRIASISKAVLESRHKHQIETALDNAGILTAEDIRQIFTHFERHEAPQIALLFYKVLRKRNEKAECWSDASLWTKLMQFIGCRSPRRFTTAAISIYSDMLHANVKPDIVTFNTIIKACGRGRHWEALQGILGDMDSHGVKGDRFTYSALLSACDTAGKWQQALEWFHVMESKGVRPSIIHFTTLMSVLQKSGRWEDSLRVFHRMEGAGIAADVVAHNAAIAACARGGDWSKAWAIFYSMKRSGLQPTVVSYNALISACEKCVQADRALEVLAMMKRMGERPNSVTYNTVASACAKAGKWDETLAIYKEMTSDAELCDDVFTLTALLTACERTQRGAQALWFFHDFVDRGGKPNVVVYNQLINALGGCGLWEEATEIFESMGDVKPDIITFGSLVAALERSGHWKRALDVYDGMNTAGVKPNGYIFASLINACEKGGQWQRASILFQTMQELDIGLFDTAMVTRKLLYAFPSLAPLIPEALVKAARAAVESGRAARRWIER